MARQGPSMDVRLVRFPDGGLQADIHVGGTYAPDILKDMISRIMELHGVEVDFVDDLEEMYADEEPPEPQP